MSSLAIKEHPILFNGEMVRAILDGRKTQTRRVAWSKHWPFEFVGPGGPNGPNKDDPACYGFESFEGEWWMLKADSPGERQIPCPYGVPGDRLWVRESVLPVGNHPDPGPCAPYGYFYRADSFDHEWADMARASGERWKPSIHMPRCACRILLEVVSVRAERVQSLSDNDALAEGVEMVRGPRSPEYGVPGLAPTFKHYLNPEFNRGEGVGVRHSFHTCWDSIYAGRGFGWDVNPMVWVVEFKVIGGGS